MYVLPMGRTLTSHIGTYLGGRYKRGEVGRATLSAHRSYLGLLDRSYGARPLERFGPAAIDRWLGSIRHLAASTRRQYLSVVRGFCRWMVGQGLIRSDPTAHVEPIRQPRRSVVTLSSEDVGAVIDAAPDARMRAVLWLMVGCGCRCVEVSRLRVEDFDPRGATLAITGKGGHERMIPAPGEVVAALVAYLDGVGWTAGPLVRSVDGVSPLLPATLSKYVRVLMADAGVKLRGRDGRSAHGLRRTAGSDVMERCGDIQVVQAMLGHAQIETTAQYYLRPVSVARLREAMEGRDYRVA